MNNPTYLQINLDQYNWILDASNYGEVSLFKTDAAYFEALESARSKWGSDNDNICGFHKNNALSGGASFSDVIENMPEFGQIYTED